MSDAVRRPTMRASLVEQIRMVGLAIRGEVAIVSVLIAFLTIGLGMAIWREGLVVSMRPDNFVLFGPLAALLPFAVWKGRDRLDASAFLTLPVEHRRHVLARVLAGWVWAMVVVSAVLAWLLALVLISDGTFVNPAPTRTILLGEATWGAPMDAGLLREVPWRPSAWVWLIPFTGATVVYAIMSAVNLATRHPVRLVGGVVIAVLLLGLATGEYAFEWLRIGLHHVLVHPWGLDTVMTGGAESLKAAVVVRDADGTFRPVTAWRDLPTLVDWLRATALWLVAAGLALWAATLRLRER